jgi:hypothetical protein
MAKATKAEKAKKTTLEPIEDVLLESSDEISVEETVIEGTATIELIEDVAHIAAGKPIHHAFNPKR